MYIMKAADTSGINWNDYFEYDENTPSCLKWKIHLGNTKNRKHAGTLDSRGYFRVSVNKSRYWVHRVVYEMFNGHLTSDMEVDHLDGNKSNNRISNLSAKTREGNQRNRPLRKDNTSGMNGVYKVIAKGQHEYWVVIWYEDKKAFKKHFSITSLGNEKALHLAKEFRQKQIEKLNLNGYGYSERHVKDKNDSI